MANTEAVIKMMALVIATMMIFTMSSFAVFAAPEGGGTGGGEGGNEGTAGGNPPAASDTVSITVNRDSTYNGEDTADSRNFTWYRVFTASYGSDFTGNSNGDGGYDSNGNPLQPAGDETHAVSYKANSTVAGVLGTWNATNKTWTKASGNLWFKLTPIAGTTDYNVEWDNSATDADTVQAAAKWLVDNHAYEDTGTLAFSDGKWSADVEKGYYVLESEAGKNLIAATTDVDVNEKNDYPPDDKTQADEDQATQSDADRNVAVGDVLDYEVKVTIPKTAKVGDQILVWDKPSSGLTYKNDVAVKSGSNTGNATIEDYSGSEGVTGASWQKLITITEESLGTDVVFTFSMTVNSSAVTDTDKKNESGLKYGRGSGDKPFPYESKPDKVEYKTYYGGIHKIDGDTEEDLSGVEFTLKEGSTEFPVTKHADGYYYYDEAGSATVTTDSDGLITIRGLDSDKTYTLTETNNPHEGYNMLAEPVTLTLYEDTTTSITYKEAEGAFTAGTKYFTKDGDNYTEATGLESFASGVTYYVIDSENTTTSFSEATEAMWDEVENNKGTILPSTGGIGTTLFYLIGAILIIGAGVLLVTRRRVDGSSAE